ncbi:MAG: acylneuraminate cytidylyltransferase family protein [Anaerolineaceae bacterium]|nr:acylneuraminate cytidylyltransferase family protein [Anaerolineaceae bacterium]
MPSIIALVPMRHHSERVPEKNFRPLAGIPLYQHILRTLEQVPEIEQTVVDTDSPVIAAGIANHFPRVRVIERPENLRPDDVSMNEILLHDVSMVSGDWYLQTHSTNPLLRAETISRAIHAMLKDYPAHDSLFTVTRLLTRLWDGQGRPVNHDPNVLLRTQDLPPMYLENSCLYMFQPGTLQTRRNRLGERPLMFEISSEEAWDIDNLLEFEIADFLAKRRNSD